MNPPKKEDRKCKYCCHVFNIYDKDRVHCGYWLHDNPMSNARICNQYEFDKGRYEGFEV